jgi:hypothetical protein
VQDSADRRIGSAGSIAWRAVGRAWCRWVIAASADGLKSAVTVSAIVPVSTWIGDGAVHRDRRRPLHRLQAAARMTTGSSASMAFVTCMLQVSIE